MPIVIWGSRGLTSTVDSGRFFCPGCGGKTHYDLKQTRPWFTLYFIPIFPTGAGQRYVECRSCGQAYQERVLDFQPPAGGQREEEEEPASDEGEQALSSAYEDLRRGSSLEKVSGNLVNDQGWPEAEAEK